MGKLAEQATQVRKQQVLARATRGTVLPPGGASGASLGDVGSVVSIQPDAWRTAEVVETNGMTAIGEVKRTKSPQEIESDLAAELVAKLARQDGSDIDVLCNKFGLKRTDLGRLTGFSVRALAEWSSGRLPSEPARRRLQEVRRLLDALAEVVKVEVIPAWLHTRNPAFDTMTPLQVIEVGEIDRLWQMVHRMSGGYVD